MRWLRSGVSYHSGVMRCSMAILVVSLIVGCRNHSAVNATESKPPVEQKPMELSGGVLVAVDLQEVRIPGFIAIDEGWLEVVACTKGTREHEAIVVTDVRPSVVHAALLLIGAKPGAPARYDQETGRSIQPHGEHVEMELEWKDSQKGPQRIALAEALQSDRDLVNPEFVFSGSLFRPNTKSMGPGEHYVADFTGNVVGLATFGDEVVAVREIHSPELAVEAESWRVKSGTLPVSGTPVELVIRIVN